VAGGIDLDLPGDGIRLRGTRWPGSGTPILLLHGLASQRRFWNLVVPRLRGLQVVALDQRGHGDSERPPEGPYDVLTCVRDALTALDALGVDRAVLVGHSWGATVALAAAAHRPDRVLAVVAIDGGVVDLSELGPREELRRRLAPPRLALPLPELQRMLTTGPLAPWWTDAHAEALLPAFVVGADDLARARLGYDLHMRLVDGMLDHATARSLPHVSCPTWVVTCENVAGRQGESDSWRHAREEAVKQAGRLLRQPRLLRWDGAVHDVPLQWPALVSGLVRAAVEELPVLGRSEGGAG
jgi:pimeloyl-ACP methyl ester carboxylesterase